MEWMPLLKATLLGIVEGVTEFLPISSTGHLIVAGTVLRFHHPTFEIVIQLGAIGAVVMVYRGDLWFRLRNARRAGTDRRVVANILLAFLPAAAIGALLHDPIKAYLFRPLTVAVALLVGGVAILLVERWARPPRTHVLERVTAGQSLGIGCAQVIAMWPGFSRAAASILGGMVAGLDRTTATCFSFYLAIPTMLGAAVVDLYGARHALRWPDLPVFAVGFVTSFLVAWIAIKGLLRYISRHNFNAFGIYRIVAACILLIGMAYGHWIE